MMERSSSALDLMESPPGPSLVSWNLTRQCNLRCPHCYIDASATPVEEELSEEDALGVVDQLAGLSPGAMVVFSGGEPLLRRDLPDLVRRAASRRLVPVLGTNGTLLEDRTLAELATCGLAGIGISLDSPDPAYHDAFRGNKGAWQKAVRAVEACRDLGLPCQIQTTLARDNLAYVRDVVELSARLGAMAFNLFFLVCTGRGESLTDVTPHEYEQALATLADLQKRFTGLRVRARCAPHFTRIMAEAGNPGGELPVGCMAGNDYLRLSPEGKVTPCPFLPIVVGDLCQQELAQVWRDSAVLRDLREGKWRGRCGACTFSRSCRGCRARAYGVSGSYLEEDPWCTHQPVNGSGAYPSSGPRWQDDARDRIERVPGFIRQRVMAYVETYARKQGYTEVTIQILEEVKSKRPMARSILPFRR
ncbi:MAG: radical SAM protein [Chloroflexi bacterium]|nr:radical SAM protein [Chloroflexota bacterium]